MNLVKPFCIIASLFTTMLHAESGAADKKKLAAALADRSTPMTWLITGDSITHGSTHTHGGRSYPEHLAERLRSEMGRPRDIIVNTGVSGEITTGILKDYTWRVARFQPQVVSINLAMNDCHRIPIEKFTTELTELVTKSKALNAIVILQATNTVYPESDRAANLPAFISAVRSIAEKQDVMLVDHYRLFSEQKQGTETKTWFSDAIHPNALGHIHMAAEMFRTIGIFSDKSPTCQLSLEK